ncbi:hypothetical protein [Gluconobacter sphaericus]|uniref:Uncharacterized protein n=1 Tax=Gluconobacter sphaericus NBRC 12467 TaxID=1307951 RepID=A0AA37SJ36_9PROT|nr:hypothetical protein [Gluconobacter sphaericus]MBF0885536.1 hypothetical protein [Gluconobacter sphaericus]GBR56495.1 hypothetical protein AA12467_2640 [Gluconobacter sphaericus NBRC 12467]GEB42774.1 hypothetical protein GSP01_15560 [Gluconobacter sphaericus NBRC 12467]GLQ84750.1 hypothetical protein GCM10007872_16580 [Gluconobacter sphaericus NBRC 12467]GLQ85095.1 hypothetical protein GCM10007872_20030 [Gluconobacter sphaericus NBRC 12467]
MPKTVIKGMARLQATLNGKVQGAQKNWMARLLERVLRRGAQMHLNAGFLEGATTTDGKPMAEIAAYNEFGTEHIPARPFMRNTVAKNQAEWPRLLAASLKVCGGDMEKAIDMTANRIVAQIQHEIETLQDPPLSQSTIDARLRNDKRRGTLKTVNMATAAKPLIDTGHMLNSVGYEVVSD